jgi:toxin-antitoxin system PIN domain toxin
VIIPDVNVLIYAHRADAPNHSHYREWLERTVNQPASFGIPALVCSGFVRVVTHPRVFDPPTAPAVALQQIAQLRSRDNFTRIEPGERHWRIFTDLCADTNAKGNLVADAYLAAIAIESGSRWATTDRDFTRFRGLDWFHPLNN